MPSFTTTTCMLMLLAPSLRGAVLHTPLPVITPGPSIADVEALVRRDEPNAVSLAQLLLTAIPESLRAIAATNLPAVTSILWEDFLDDKKPEWFKDLPADVQSYLIRNFGPSTAWPTPTPTDTRSTSAATTEPSSAQTSDASSETGVITSTITVSTVSTGIPIAVSTNPSVVDSTSSSSSDTDLSRNQKIAIGLGVPLAVLSAAALVLACYFLLRQRYKKTVNGSQPPSSPGFIPRFAFQEKSEHQTPLNSISGGNRFSQDTSYSNYSNWDDDVIETLENTQASRGDEMNPDNNFHGAPIPVPSLYHTHSSNRARGTRTSYSSLHSVAEVQEPDESPVLPRDRFGPSPPRRLSAGLISGAAQVTRKPVPSVASNTSPRSSTNSYAGRNSLTVATATATAPTSHEPSILDQNNINNSSNSSNSLTSGSGHGNCTNVAASPVSPISTSPPSPSPFRSSSPSRPSQSFNPFTKDPEAPNSTNSFKSDYYNEDYGPEYSHVYQYDDLENGLYGGLTDLSRYPQYPEVPAKGSGRTEWPLRNVMGSIGSKKNKSTLWDRVYDA